MQSPVQVEFRGIAAADDLREKINAHVAQLESFFGRITACRVVLKAPSGHHQTGGQFEVHIKLALPDGREINVGRTPKADQRHADIDFAITDAFHRARRRLQQQIRRMQSNAKMQDSAA